MNFLWKIGGEAGFGIMTTGLTFCKLSTRSGYYIYEYTEYPSLIRGGHNTTEVHVSDSPIHSTKYEVDMLVCLNKDTYKLHKNRLHKDSIVVYDPNETNFEGPGIAIQIPFRKFKRQKKVFQMMVNTIAFGAVTALLDGDITMFHAMIEQEFKRKGDKIVQQNNMLADLGYNYVTTHYANHVQSVLSPKPTEPKMVLTGNDAFSLATVSADCKMYVAYPMTPASSVLSTLAGWEKKTGMVVRHAEDEISVINTALGASFAGVRTSVGTSGGGFALMVESVSFAGVAEIPIVIFMSQRPGPATGMPTWTEQGDLLFTVHSGHGEFPKIVFTPGDVEEMLSLTLKAFDMADIYQTPVIVMSDKLLSESHMTVSKETVKSLLQSYVPNRGKIVRNPTETPYLRYRCNEALPSDGISEMLVPGAKGHFYQANSYEHEQNSHTSEDPVDRIKQVYKRQSKSYTYLEQHFAMPEIFGSIDKANVVLVSWGGNKGIIRDAQVELNDKNISTAFIHFTHVYPLDKEKVIQLFSFDKPTLVIENNSTAQFAQLLRQQTGISIDQHLLRNDGRPLEVINVVEHVTNNFS